jgi:outer membrane protein TolC
MRALTILLLVLASCATAAGPASRPVVASQLPYADIVAVQMGSHDGVFIEMGAFRDILKGHELEKGELRNSAAQAVAGKEFYRAEAEEMKRLAAQQASRATWMPLIGAGAGALTVGIIWLLFEGVKAAVQGAH